MFKFETQLKKLKHEVLTEVAKLAKNDDITLESIEKVPYEVIKGDVAHYRCCVYKERAIVLERAKLAAGYLANGDNAEESLIDIKPDEQIIYVIEAACDRCPINKFNVTDSCRNCIAHRCKEACNFGAITIVNGRAYINQDDRRAMIKEEICVNCGSCMRSCPFGAISDKSLIVPVAKGLARHRKMYAVVAPAITGQFGPTMNYGKIRNAIKAIGFEDMIEAALGADAVTVNEANEFVERMERGDKYMTNSCCPGFLSFIEKVNPTEKNRVSGTVSPMVAAARYIKKNDPEAKVVFIGPCTAKKGEAVRIGIADAVDYVLTFEELLALFEAFEVNPFECEEENVNDASIFGRGFGAAGGLTAAIKNYLQDSEVNVEFKPVQVSGLDCKKTMMLAKMGKLPGNFIEGMMCEGGCINGAGAIVPPLRAKAAFNKINNGTTIKAVLKNEALSKFDDVDLER